MKLKCYRCKKWLLVSNFYTNKAQHRGYSGWCKNCWKEYRSRPEVKERNQKYFQKYHQIEKNRKRVREKQREYRKKNRIRFNERERGYRKKFPEKYRAREKLRKAVRDGKMERGNCQVCGTPNAHGHHDDYSKPYNVKWLCRLHHKEYEKTLRG